MTTTDPPATPPVEIWPGRPAPLGAHWDGQGTNFAVFSEQAESIDLCLFDLDGEAAGTETCIPIEEVDSHTWHVYLPGVGPGTHYGYRVTGPWNPDGGQWFNHNKLLLDPYAKAIEGEVAKVVFGQGPLTRMVTIALLAGGHVLLEGVPGLAKTLSVRTLASAIHANRRTAFFLPMPGRMSTRASSRTSSRGS